MTLVPMILNYYCVQQNNHMTNCQIRTKSVIYETQCLDLQFLLGKLTLNHSHYQLIKKYLRKLQ